ncbi:MAG: hypothetical protein Q4F57_00190 [Weeksellaceae bacterium]|nr:hypothetical protein [Weeksellaceae bacterium]
MHRLWIIIFLLLLFVSAIATSYESGLRYLKYLLIAAPFIKLMSVKQYAVNRTLFSNLLLYMFLISINLVVAFIGNDFSMRMFMEILLILIPISAAIGFSEMDEKSNMKLLKYLFYIYATAFFIVFWQEFINLGSLFKNLPRAILYSQFKTESWMGFVFAIFSLFFFLTKQRIHLIVALVLMFFAFKRVTWAASFASISAFFFLFQLLKFRFRPMQFKLLFAGVLVVFISLFFGFISGEFTTFIQTQTGISINHFTQGRFFLYNRALHYFSENYNLWFGSYLGATYDFLEPRYPNVDFLHSDLLKLILEIGIILFIIWFISFININMTNKYTFALLIFVFVLFFTDNTLIYFDLMFLFYLFINYFSRSDAQQNIE